MRYALSLTAAAILALSLLACGGGDDDSGADAGEGADASLADYSEENCDELLFAPQVEDMNCCYSGGFQNACGEDVPGLQMYEIDGVLGCADQKIGDVIECAFFECEAFVANPAECE
jgi:hypothetical protein